jgi:hypothetical protein
LEGFDRLLKTSGFSYSKNTKEVEKLWLRKSSSFTGFCMDCLEEEYSSIISKKDLRYKYVIYCRKNKLRIATDKIIKNHLETSFGCYDSQKTIDGVRERFWEGINFKQNYTDNTDNTPYSTPRAKSDFTLEVNNGVFPGSDVKNEYKNQTSIGFSTKKTHKIRIFQKCSICQNMNNVFVGNDLKPYCYDCGNSLKAQGKNIFEERVD